MGGEGLTRRLARDISRVAAEDAIPDGVRAEARRTFANVLGVAIGARREPGTDIMVAQAVAHGGGGSIAIPGRDERTDILNAATTIGFEAHLDDYDDTHLETVIHVGASSLAAALSIGQAQGSTGAEVMRAFTLGSEVTLRIGVAMSPSHYDRGWHISGTCGAFGAATAAGLLMGFEADDLERAFVIAANMTIGVRDAFGTMTKPFHPGKAAANGVLAARLAARLGAGVPTSEDVLTGDHGVFAVLSDAFDVSRVTASYDDTWELLKNSYKPYPCGIVIHPVIDAALELSSVVAGRTDRIDGVRIACHPLVVELTGNPEPRDGLEARFSAIHGAAAGLLDGEVGLAQYRDERVTAADLVTLRARCRLVIDTALDRDAAAIEVDVAGETLRAMVPHARGSIARPLTDQELASKIERLVEPVLPGRTAALLAEVMGLEDASSLQQLIDLSRPGGRPGLPSGEENA